MQLIIIGEYLYFRYLKYLVIAFFFLLGGGAIGLCPFFFLGIRNYSFFSIPTEWGEHPGCNFAVEKKNDPLF